LKLPESSLVHTVAYCNVHAARGAAPFFYKVASYLRPLAQPPFAAIDLSVDRAIVPRFTKGGLDTSVAGEVLRPDGRVVAGLYGAGRRTCGLPRTAARYSRGVSIGCATYFGRLVGASAALNLAS
jgi:3-oxo-5alpha-steroid 4-dehydrogenase